MCLEAVVLFDLTSKFYQLVHVSVYFTTTDSYGHFIIRIGKICIILPYHPETVKLFSIIQL